MAEQNSSEEHEYLAGNEQYRHRTHKWRGRSRKELLREELLKSFYGTKAATLELEALQRPASHISDSISDIMKGFKLDHKLVFSKLLEQWEVLVGGQIAASARPVAIVEKKLSIEVDNASVLYTLEHFMKKDILDRVKSVCGKDVTEIRFVPAGRNVRRESDRFND